jgi:hypothetical protein
MDEEKPMSSTPGHKPKSDSYAYSWFLPAPGTNGSANGWRVPVAEPEAAETRSPEIAEQEKRTEAWRHSAEKKSAPPLLGSLSVSQRIIGVVGVIGWSAVAGTGAAFLIARASEFPTTQIGILAGVWVGVSAAIWFMPRFLSRKTNVKA